MIQVENLSVRLGAFRLDDISFDVAAGTWSVLMGRSGAGKTTVLEAICGLRPIAGGRVSIAGRDVTDRKSAERGIGYVPQDGALFSTMTVRRHLSFPLEIRKQAKDRIGARVKELAGLLGIDHLLDRLPRGLSGGEIQRVAVGRALSYHPSVLCLDEPFSSLDDQTREEMYELMRSVCTATGCTVLHVTHNLREAEVLGDVIFHLDGSQVAVSGGG